MAFTPTPEQSHARDLYLSGESLVIRAYAGSGKTSTLKLLANATPDRQLLYTTFGAKNVADAKVSMPRNVRSVTNHGLAYRTHGVQFRDAGRLDTALSPKMLASYMGDRFAVSGLTSVDTAYCALQTLQAYLQSADVDLSRSHLRVSRQAHSATEGEIDEIALRYAQHLWQRMTNTNDTMPCSHDVYLKLWALSRPQLKADGILLDEAQDTTPLIIDVLQQQVARGTPLIVVGDTFQSIYGWRGACDAMSAFPIQNQTALTQSFRFGERIAEAANRLLAVLDPSVAIRGNPALDTQINLCPGRTVLARTNGALLGELAAMGDAIRTAVVVGGTAEMLRLCEGAEDLMRGRPARAPELMGFVNWDEVTEYAKLPAGKDIKPLVSAVDAYGIATLQQMLRAVPANPDAAAEARAHTILSTAHKAKGREWDEVRLTDDYAAPTEADLQIPGADPSKRTNWGHEDTHLLYVAVTRAREQLNIANCTAYHATRAMADLVAPLTETPDLTTPRGTPSAPTAVAPPLAAPSAPRRDLPDAMPAALAQQTPSQARITDLAALVAAARDAGDAAFFTELARHAQSASPVATTAVTPSTARRPPDRLVAGMRGLPSCF